MIKLNKGSVIGPECIVARECLARELFEDRAVTQLVTSDRINDWVAATSMSGTMTSTSSWLNRSMAVSSWSAPTAFSSRHLQVPGSSEASTASQDPKSVAT